MLELVFSIIDFRSVIKFLGDFSADDILTFVGWGLVVLFFCGTVGLLPKGVASGLMISLGIFGTFWGISNALQPLDFSPDKMNDSVQALLDGMKTAFYTSLLGIGAAVGSKFLWSFFLYRFIDDKVVKLLKKLFRPPLPPPGWDIIEKLEAIRQAIAGDGGKRVDLVSQLEELKKTIAGDGDSSLVNQMLKLRDENKDGFVKLEGVSDSVRVALVENFESVGEKLAAVRQAISGDGQVDLGSRLDALQDAVAGEGNSSLATQLRALQEVNKVGFSQLEGLSDTIRITLVNNLKEVTEKLSAELREIIAKQLGGQLEKLIVDIEKALIEQFGETFVEFNKGVQALKKWQEDHKVQVEQLTAAFVLAAQGIGQIKESCEIIRDDCEKIPEAMGKLSDVIEIADGQIKSIVELMENSKVIMAQFAGVSGKAQEMLPKIQQIILDATTEFKRQMEEMSGEMKEKMGQSQGDIHKKVEETAGKAVGDIAQAHEKLVREWGQHMVGLARRLEEAIKAADDVRRNENRHGGGSRGEI